MELFVDFQGFKDSSNIFIIKEFAIVSTDGKVVQHWIVRSPYPFATLDSKAKRQCTWTTNYYHGIHWKDGDITIQNLHRQVQLLMQDSVVVYVKGLEKAEYIKHFFKPSLVIELENYPSLKLLHNPQVHCFLHRASNKVCALNNVLKLASYYFFNKKKTLK